MKWLIVVQSFTRVYRSFSSAALNEFFMKFILRESVADEVRHRQILPTKWEFCVNVSNLYLIGAIIVYILVSICVIYIILTPYVYN